MRRIGWLLFLLVLSGCGPRTPSYSPPTPCCRPAPPPCCPPEDPCPLGTVTLEEAEAIALSHNPDLHRMRQLLMRAQQGRLDALSKWLPELNLVSLGYKAEEVVMFANARSAFLTQLNTTQALISTDKWFDAKIAGLIVQQMRALLNAATIDILFQTRTLYYQLVYDRETVETAKQKIELLTSLAVQEQADYKIGTTILLNVNQSKVAVANASSVYYDAIKRYRVDLDAFVRVLGYDPGKVEVEIGSEGIPIGSIPELATKVDRMAALFEEGDPEGPIYKKGYPITQERLMATLFSPSEVASWEGLALTYRPELAEARTEVRIAQEEVGKQRGEYWPQINLEFNYGGYPTKMLDTPTSNFFNQSFSWGLGYSVKWLLFDGFGRRYRISKAIHNRSAKQFEYQKSVQMAYEDVRKQIFEIEDGVASFVTAESNVRLAQQTLDLAKSQLEIGYITVFDYQIVVDNLIDALNIRNRAEFDLMAGYYGLIHASGADLRCR
ncbi:MAG: TolC family protein [Parachlamydiales bacterium]